MPEIRVSGFEVRFVSMCPHLICSRRVQSAFKSGVVVGTGARCRSIGTRWVHVRIEGEGVAGVELGGVKEMAIDKDMAVLRPLACIQDEQVDAPCLHAHTSDPSLADGTEGEGGGGTRLGHAHVPHFHTYLWQRRRDVGVDDAHEHAELP